MEKFRQTLNLKKNSEKLPLPPSLNSKTQIYICLVTN
ncbi:Protein CBG25363 [Caenorhabditis briggsae]|uniref:Protein CBG25363 n=1 Tax=Caenorhabditis briggsae TaxID=6238 RepID=B6IIM7_CAEBR|nr:Protein CBG25363 [Caenorhabditis briggsae]CAR99757.1 Protein CBG25363 [Caenorhabditis briggsae]